MGFKIHAFSLYKREKGFYTRFLPFLGVFSLAEITNLSEKKCIGNNAQRQVQSKDVWSCLFRMPVCSSRGMSEDR